MSAFFGFFDPEHLLRHQHVAERMARALLKPPGSETRIEFNGSGCVGLVANPGTRREGWLQVEPGGTVRVQLGRVVNRDDPEGEASRDDELSGPVLRGLRGHFVLARMEPGRGLLTVATDHFGSRPLYLYRQDGIIIFSTQVKAILAALDKDWQLDPLSVSTMLSFGEMVGNRTMISGITTLPAATVLTMGRGGAVTSTYWQFQYRPDHSLNWGEAVEAIGQALNQAVGRGMVHKKSPAVPLSGGLDSRFMLEIAQKSTHPSTYTWGLPGCRDVEFAKATAKRLGVPHHVWYFDPGYLEILADRGSWITEGHTPTTNFHVLPFVDRMAEQGHDTMLDGFAGDGLLGGNWITDEWLKTSDYQAAGRALWNWRRVAFCGGREHGLLSDMEARARETFTGLYQRYPGDTPMDRAVAFLIDNRLRRTTMCGTEIFRTRLPVWQPFWDIDVMQLIARVPHEWKRRHRFYLEVFKAYAPRSAGAPYQRTGLPANMPYAVTWLSLAAHRATDEVVSRLGLPNPFADKSPSDFPAWFRGPLRPWVEGILLSERCLDRGAIPPDAVRRLLDMHFSGEQNLAFQIGALLSVEIFCRNFLDEFEQSIERFSGPLARPPATALAAA